MITTVDDLAETTQVEIIELCNKRLADAVDLHLQSKYAHWNVKGPNFRTLHELFDQVNSDVENYVDLIAERAVQVGGVADYTAYVVPMWADIAEYRADGGSEQAIVRALAAALDSFGKLVLEAVAKCDELRDVVSADMFTEIARGIDKWLWMVRAHQSTN